MGPVGEVGAVGAEGVDEDSTLLVCSLLVSCLGGEMGVEGEEGEVGLEGAAAEVGAVGFFSVVTAETTTLSGTGGFGCSHAGTGPCDVDGASGASCFLNSVLLLSLSVIVSGTRVGTVTSTFLASFIGSGPFSSTSGSFFTMVPSIFSRVA